MASLNIDLQEGFADDTVIIRINNKEVFSKENVTTRLQIGLADSFEVTVEEGSVNVDIQVSSKNLSKTIELQVTTKVYIGVSILEGKIDYRISDTLFGYV